MLKVVTGAHLNGVNGYYNLEQGVEYTITLDVDATNFAPNLEFTIFKGSPKKFGEYYIDGNETVSIKFTPDASGEHRINLRLRQSGYSGGDQTFYIDNLYIAPSLEIVEENNYYPFGLQHRGYNNVVSANANSTASNWRYNGKEITEDLGLNVYDYGARNYDPAIGRWWQIDPLAVAYNEYSPYNYTLNNPIYFKDPDGRRVIANDEETQNIILGYITDQLGENNGFFFNSKGVLKHRGSRAHRSAKDNYSEEQKSIFDGITEVANDDDKVIEVNINADSNEFTVDVYEPGFVKDAEDRFVNDENGIPRREGWQKVAEADLNTENTGGALFWATGKLDNTNQAYGHLVINRKTASTIELKADGGKLTTPSESSVFIHEILDHGLDFIRNGNINSSSGSGVENVKFHNQALKNISKGESPLRNTHYDEK